MNKDIKMKIRMNIKKKLNLKGGDGYSANPFQPIGGMMSYPRYSNNYRPVFEGELLSDDSMNNNENQIGGSKTNNCGCNKKKEEPSIYNLIKKQNGGNPSSITQVSAIDEVSKMLKPLGIGALISTIVIIFLYHCTNKKPRKGVQLGGFTPDLESVLAPLGKNNLLVLASLLLLHHFAIINYKDNKKDKKMLLDSKLKKVQNGGDIIKSLLNSLLYPIGLSNKKEESVIDTIDNSFKNANNKGNSNNNDEDNIQVTKIQMTNQYGGSKLASHISYLGNKSLMAHSMFYLLEDIFNNKVKIIGEKDKSIKMKLTDKLIKKNNKLFYMLSPISFNLFGNEEKIQQIFNKIKESKMTKKSL
jgi:hypothetical protein